jgi:hypothetical protein
VRFDACYFWRKYFFSAWTARINNFDRHVRHGAIRKRNGIEFNLSARRRNLGVFTDNVRGRRNSFEFRRYDYDELRDNFKPHNADANRRSS